MFFQRRWQPLGFLGFPVVLQSREITLMNWIYFEWEVLSVNSEAEIVTAFTQPPNINSAIPHIQKFLYYSNLVQTNVYLLQSFRDDHGILLQYRQSLVNKCTFITGKLVQISWQDSRLPKLVYESPSHSRPCGVSRCGAPTHLLPWYPLAHDVLLFLSAWSRTLGLCPFSGLVCDRLLWGGRGLSPQCTLTEEYLGHDLDEHCLEVTGVVWCLAYPSVGGTISWALCSLVVRETCIYIYIYIYIYMYIDLKFLILSTNSLMVKMIQEKRLREALLLT